MDRDTELKLLAESLALTLEERVPLEGEETLVPTQEYLDQARFEREHERVFRRSLNLATLGSEVPRPGDFVTTEVADAPVIIVRGDDEKVRAFLNVCRHRGATVERKAKGRCARFVCPYHAWTYDRDGSLHRVRHLEGFPTLDKSQHGLVELACVEQAGLVFVCPTPSLEPDPLPGELVTELERMLGPRPTAYGRSARTWKVNWKIIVEGGIESYHFRVAHKDTIARFFGDTSSTWQRIGEHMRSVLPKRSIAELRDLPEEQWSIRDHTHVLYSLHPNAVILTQKSHFDLVLLRPIAVDQTHVEVLTVGTAPEEGELSERGRAFFEQNHAFSVRTLDEDFQIGEEIQRGLKTGANSHFRFGRFEDALADWRERLQATLT